MSVTLRIKRGTEQEIMSHDLAIGEMALATDTRAVFISNGVVKALIGHVTVDLLENRPLSGVTGRTFLESETGILYVDTTSGWIPVGNVDELDGDRLPIDWTPSNSTPKVVQDVTTETGQLTSHLRGIDEAIGSKADSGHDHVDSHPPLTHADRHASGGEDEIDGDRLDIDWNPENYVPEIVSETTTDYHLSSHLKGIDRGFANLGSDATALENTLVMMAWDLYSEDRAFDDIYVDDFTDTSGIDATLDQDRLRGESSGIYDFAGAFLKSAGSRTGVSTDVITSQTDCSEWSSINSVSVTQSTPGNVASQIYHAVSFDGKITWKVFKTGSWMSIARNNGGTWQYYNEGAWANSSENTQSVALIQATSQTGHQWTKTDIEAMSGADWEAYNGWSEEVLTIDWASRGVSGWTIISSGNDNPDETNVVTAQTDGANALASSETAGYEGWKLFDHAHGPGHRWLSAINNTTGWVRFDFGSDNRQVINKYRWRTFENNSNAVAGAWQFQGSNDGSSWTTLHEGSNTVQTADTWIGWFTFANSDFYRYYRINVTANLGHAQYLCMDELQMVKAQSVDEPVFEKVTFNHDTDAIALDVVTKSWEASADDPTDAYCVIDMEPDDTLSLNSDIKAFVSINDGVDWQQIMLEEAPFRTIGVHHYVRGDCYGITGRSDRTIRFRFTTCNDKGLKVRAIAGGVRYHD